jgi:hypothetical protein
MDAVAALERAQEAHRHQAWADACLQQGLAATAQAGDRLVGGEHLNVGTGS